MNNLDLKLFELFADKTLSEGCLVWDFESPNTYWYKIITYEEFDCVVNWDSEFMRVISFHRKKEIYEYDSRDVEWANSIKYLKSHILWHEPQLHDVFMVANEKCYWWNMNDWDLSITFYYENRNLPPIKWYNPTLPLIQQSDSTKEQLIKLFS